ncbi:CoA transferase [Bradyrhizobium manausense]|nr:CoA transferase [Bradyrhizobium manausense]
MARQPTDLLRDPHLGSRGFLQEVERAFVGLHPQPSMPIRDGSGPFAVRTAAPTLGEHNSEILSEFLRLSDTEIAQLASEGIIGASMASEKLAKSSCREHV